MLSMAINEAMRILLAPSTEGWHSIIGIVTAICGNILISFALNTQRYAHMRLSRERDERQSKADEERRGEVKASDRHGVGSENEDPEQGDEAEDSAERRAAINAESRPSDDLEEAHESDPLIPKLNRDPQASNKANGTFDHARAEQEDRTGDQDYDEKDGEKEKEKSYLKSPVWWLGIGLMTVGEAGNFLAYGFAPASIVSPLGVVALISNCLIAPLLLHEPFRLRDGTGVLIAVAGCVTVVLSASGSNPKLNQDKIWQLISSWEFETYFGITVFLILVLMVLSNKFGDKSILIDLGLVGLFGGYTALATKGVASLLSNTIWRVVTFPITYLLVAILVGTAVMQIKYVNRALQRFNSTMVIPTQFVLFTLSVIIGSAILYRDFERTTAEDAAKFVGGCALTFLGVWCITSGRKDENTSDEESAGRDGKVSLVDEEGVQPEIRQRRRSAGKNRPVASASIPSTAPHGGPPSSELYERLPNIDERRPFRNEAWVVSDANVAAIHVDDASQLPQRPEDANKNQKPRMHATTSEPVVPTINLAIPRPETPLNRSPSGPPTTPSTAQHSTADDPFTTPRRERSHFLDAADTPTRSSQQQERQRLVSRNSLVGLLPGPLTSPLSGSLSAIVADSLRRGMDRHESSTSTIRRPRRNTRQPSELEDVRESTFAGESMAKRHSIASTDLQFQHDGEDVTSSQRKGRSWSATMGEASSDGDKKWQSSRTKQGGHGSAGGSGT